MLFAIDYNDNRVHIDETHSNQEYFWILYTNGEISTKTWEVLVDKKQINIV